MPTPHQLLIARFHEMEITCAELARRMKMNRCHVSELLNQNKNPTHATLMKFAQAVGVEFDARVVGDGQSAAAPKVKKGN